MRYAFEDGYYDIVQTILLSGDIPAEMEYFSQQMIRSVKDTIPDQDNRKETLMEIEKLLKQIRGTQDRDLANFYFEWVDYATTNDWFTSREKSTASDLVKELQNEQKEANEHHRRITSMQA